MSGNMPYLGYLPEGILDYLESTPAYYSYINEHFF
ncbi:hypothetical protein ES703_116503 [subsurface metagenome]